MDNNDLLVILGIGLLCSGLAHLLPFTAGGLVAGTARPVWVPAVLGVAAAVAGALVFLTVLVR